MRSTTWIAVLATSPELLAFLTVLIALMESIVAISDAIAYCETQFYRCLGSNALVYESILGPSEGFSALIHEIWTPVDESAIDLH